MQCKYCGNNLAKESNYCGRCGKKIEDTFNQTNEGKGIAITSMVIGIISLLFGTLFIPLPIIGLVLAGSYKGKCTEKTVGIVINTISLILSIISIIFIFVIGISSIRDLTNNSNIVYEGNWDELSIYVDEERVDSIEKLVGKWKELTDGGKYIIFNETNYYIYEDANNMESNYSRGFYNELDGTQALDNMSYFLKYSKKINKIFGTKHDDLYFWVLDLNRSEENVNNYYIDDNEIKSFNIVAFTTVHGNVVELTLINLDDDTVNHFYKVKE